MRLLVVEDDPKMASLLERGLRGHGYTVDVATRGDDAVFAAAAVAYEAIVLDVMLPGQDGFVTVQQMRRAGIWSPVLMLTARDTLADRVTGLDAGADDYLRKPFAFAELVARIRALTRRAPEPRPVVIEAGGLRLDPAARTVFRGATEIALSTREFALLEALMKGAGRVLSRQQLLDHAWDDADDLFSNIVDSAIRRLRLRIDEPFGTDTVEAVRGVGYRLRRVPC